MCCYCCCSEIYESFYTYTPRPMSALILFRRQFYVSAATSSSGKRKAHPTKSSQEGVESDNSGADWRKYLKFEADDEVADRAEAGSATSASASVISRWNASSTAGVAEERRSADASGSTDNYRRRSDTVTVPSSRSPLSPSLSRDSKEAPSDTVWMTSSAADDDKERQNDRINWLVFCVWIINVL